MKTGFILIFCVSALLSGCGGGSKTVTPAPSSTTSNSSCATGVSAPLGSPSLITVSGQNASADINVGGPQACPTPNAQVLGIANVGASSISATNVGVQMHRGDTKIMILFGAGLTAVTSVSVAGQPNDFVISNITHPSATDGTPGVQFNVTVSPTAALGARTVILRAANDDMTTFTGGVEVLP